ncbi:hypothetical protein HK405_013088 [Cladochytrium tenue]|nr:hypothetical protein HK405_013088 [Cladochytrium tenue]
MSRPTSSPPPLAPDDQRVRHLQAPVADGIAYHYLLAEPSRVGPLHSDGPPPTIVLLHGWPDISMAWRYQVPYLVTRGYRVVVPDMLGYGQTSKPHDPAEYAIKKIASHIKALVHHVFAGDRGYGNTSVVVPKIILGGHDWGGYSAWRIAMWQPEIVAAVFSLNVPYNAPTRTYLDLETIAQAVPTFRYQLQLAGPHVEAAVGRSRENLRGFLNGVYGGSLPGGSGSAFRVDSGVIPESALRNIGPAKLMSREMMDHYVAEFGRDGGSFRGPLNWYRTRRHNWEDELEFANAPRPFVFSVPGLVVMAEKDPALPPILADGMERWFAPGLLRKEVLRGVGHWAMWQNPDAVNMILGSWLESLPAPFSPPSRSSSSSVVSSKL